MSEPYYIGDVLYGYCPDCEHSFDVLYMLPLMESNIAHKLVEKIKDEDPKSYCLGCWMNRHEGLAPKEFLEEFINVSVQGQVTESERLELEVEREAYQAVWMNSGKT